MIESQLIWTAVAMHGGKAPQEREALSQSHYCRILSQYKSCGQSRPPRLGI